MSRKTFAIWLIIFGSILVLVAFMLININTLQDIQTKLFNRIGILFSLLGGFMIAPEIIGLARIKRIELRFNRNYQVITKNIKTLQKKIIHSEIIPFFFMWGLAIGVFLALAAIVNKHLILGYITQPSTIPPSFKALAVILLLYFAISTVILVIIFILGLSTIDAPQADNKRFRPKFHIYLNPTTFIQILFVADIALTIALIAVTPVLVILGSLYFLLIVFSNLLCRVS